MDSRSRRRRPFLGIALLALAVAAVTTPAAAQNAPQERPAFFMVMHGGAGTIRRADMTPVQDSAYRAKMTEAITTGYDVLKRGGTSVDAVEAAIEVLEDSPLFNAGKGAVFTNAGTNELDASIMNGKTLAAGAVAGVKHIKNPISLARLVMEKSPHVLLVGEGAEEFARSQGVEMVPQHYFFTQRRWDELQRMKAEEKKTGKPVIGLLEQPEPQPELGAAGLIYNYSDKHGTVGAVALDRYGNLAAGTSTGGLSNKRWGRVGDSPLIGAGTYANNESCAVSSTGIGEYFIRNVVAHDICARVEYLHESVAEAAHDVIFDKVGAKGGSGGVIVLDRNGDFTTTFNTEGMYRAFVGPDGEVTVHIYKDEK